MEYNKKINIRVTSGQLKILISAATDEKTTLSSLIRNIINGYELENPRAFYKTKPKSEK